MKNYQEWYQNISSRLTSHPPLLFLLRSFNRLMTFTMPLVYLALLVTTYLQLGLGQQVGIYLFIPASGFVILSLFRKKLGTSVPCLKKIARDSRCPVAMFFRQPSSPWPVCMLVYLLA